jgi:hypothetical protein
VSPTVGFCTLAIHEPYRQRARLLIRDLAPAFQIVLTDDPATFRDLPVRAVAHAPSGPMAIDYLERLAPTGESRGAAAYHDKRFALQAALEVCETAIFLDADTRVDAVPSPPALPPGLSVAPLVRKSVAEHLETCGEWRLNVFRDLARALMGDTGALDAAPWCHETPLAVTRTEHLDRFFSAWAFGAEFFQQRRVYSGEGGVIGLAAAYAGWQVDYDALSWLLPLIHHEGGGPKQV